MPCRSLLSIVAALGLALAVGLLPADLASQTKQPPQQNINPRDKESVLKSDVNFLDPRVLSSEGRAGLSVTLEVKLALHTIDKDRVLLRTYNGALPAPTLRVRPGDTLKVKLKNSLPPGESPHPPAPNQPHGLDWTNLHTHGLHVSPARPGDDVSLDVGPGFEYDYEFKIPANHPCGTFWYHAHRHGSVALQLSSGMAGALIVEGQGLDTMPEIKAACEKVFLFQQITYRLNAQQIGEVLPGDIYGGYPDPGWKAETTINGVLAPVFEMAPGEVQRWRLIHAGLQETIDLAFVDASDYGKTTPLHEIAVDGLATGTIEAKDNVLLQPAYRSDVLVKAPATPGSYLLINKELTSADTIHRTKQGLKYLAKVLVRGQPRNMDLPKAADVARHRAFPHLEAAAVSVKRDIFFSYDGQSQFLVNGKAYDNHTDVPRPRRGTVEEWTLTAKGGLHPFHIHVNPFEVIEVDPKTGQETGKGVWRDTIVVKSGPKNAVKIRIRFDDFVGKSVLHCHILPHEDQGMMMRFEILDEKAEAPARGLKGLPVVAPAWELPDAAGAKHRLADYAGKPVILVFFRGTGCEHCLGQWKALAERRKALADAGIAVVGICPDDPPELAEALRGPAGKVLPFPILSDPQQGVFRRYGCDGRPVLHGTFLVDPAGAVRWQSVGDEPYADADALLARARALIVP